MSLFKRARDGVARLLQSTRVLPAHIDRNYHTRSVQVGRLLGIEECLEVIDNEEAKLLPDESVNVLNFDALVSQLNGLDGDAPIRFVVFAGLKSRRPLTSINMTMTELRQLGLIIRKFKEVTE